MGELFLIVFSVITPLRDITDIAHLNPEISILSVRNNVLKMYYSPSLFDINEGKKVYFRFHILSSPLYSDFLLYYTFIGYSYPFKKGVLSLNISQITFSERIYPYKPFKNSDFLINLSAGKEINKFTRIGISGKIVYYSLTSPSMGGSECSLIYAPQTKIMTSTSTSFIFQRFHILFSIDNLTLNGDFFENSKFHTGISREIKFSKNNSILLTVEYVGIHQENKYLIIGGNLDIKNFLFIRGGYIINQTKEYTKKFSFEAILSYKNFEIGFGFGRPFGSYYTELRKFSIVFKW